MSGDIDEMSLSYGEPQTITVAHFHMGLKGRKILFFGERKERSKGLQAVFWRSLCGVNHVGFE